ncbi:MAG TPA: class I SAM-dependent methyltransferase, partial [Vicinamibacteria bacterium]
SFHLLTPLYDLGTALFGFGRRFKEGVVAQAGLADGARVLDVGCGTGQLADALKRAHPRATVVGVDADPRILEIARRRIARAGHAGVELVCARAERTGLEGASFDTALSTLVFHHLPVEAKEGAVREITRLLRPGGRFLLVDLRPLMAVGRPLDPEGRRSMRLALRANTPEMLGVIFEEAGLEVDSVPAPQTWIPLLRTFGLRATKPA